MLKVTLTQSELKPEARAKAIEEIAIQDLGSKGNAVVIAADILAIQMNGHEKVLKNRNCAVGTAKIKTT